MACSICRKAADFQCSLFLRLFFFWRKLLRNKKFCDWDGYFVQEKIKFKKSIDNKDTSFDFERTFHLHDVIVWCCFKLAMQVALYNRSWDVHGIHDMSDSRSHNSFTSKKVTSLHLLFTLSLHWAVTFSPSHHPWATVQSLEIIGFISFWIVSLRKRNIPKMDAPETAWPTC